MLYLCRFLFCEGPSLREEYDKAFNNNYRCNIMKNVMHVLHITPSLKLTYKLNATLLLNKVVDDDLVMSSKQTLVSM